VSLHGETNIALNPNGYMPSVLYILPDCRMWKCLYKQKLQWQSKKATGNLLAMTHISLSARPASCESGSGLED